MTKYEHTEFVSIGLKAVMQKADDAPEELKPKWNELTARLIEDNPVIVAVAEEAVLKRAGYLNLSGQHGQNLTRQIDVIGMFLENKDGTVRKRYTAQMNAQLAQLDQDFSKALPALTSINDLDALKALVELRAEQEQIVKLRDQAQQPMSKTKPRF